MESKFGHDPASGARWEIHGPSEGRAVVEAWADACIPFEPPKNSWKSELRDALRSRCRMLEPLAGQLLHATFFGAMPPRSDVENLLLYNIDDSFKVPGSNGIRFEHGAGVPPTSDGREYPYCYRYLLAPQSGRFNYWQQVRQLAWFDWTDLGEFDDDKGVLAQVWLALSGGEVNLLELCASEALFAVSVQLRPPRGISPLWGKLVKGVFDGLICAFQAHTDTKDLTQIVDRLASQLQTDAEVIKGYLLDERITDQSRAVLGDVARLVFLRGSGVQWNPSDHLCMAGELLTAQPIDDRWAIKGEVVELSR